MCIRAISCFGSKVAYKDRFLHTNACIYNAQRHMIHCIIFFLLSCIIYTNFHIYVQTSMAPNEDTTVKKYLVLEPQEASLSGIFRVLISGDAEGKDFIKIFPAETTVLEDKCLIVLSLLVQKLLRCCEWRLSKLGSKYETCLNIVGNKANFAVFLKSFLRGEKLVWPDKDSASYSSVIGFLDPRVELDKNIEPGCNNKYYATLCAMASKLAYENNEFIRLTVEKTWKMELVGQGAYSFRNEQLNRDSTQAFMFQDKSTNPDTIIVAFRGTEPFNTSDWSSDCDISWYKLQGIKGRVHHGFITALGMKSDGTWPPNSTEADNQNRYAYNTITEELKGHLRNNPTAKIVVTGHSLGGALAVLFPAVLALHNEVAILQRLEAVYTFGQPRVGDQKFGMFMKGQFEHYGIGYYRFVYNYDVVPRVPFDCSELTFKHFGKCIYINSLYEAEIVEEEPLKNYFAWGASFVSKRADVVWEVVRSFVLPHMFGPDYKESLLQQMFRMFGLIFPGVPAHGPQDYINATRLAYY